MMNEPERPICAGTWAPMELAWYESYLEREPESGPTIVFQREDDQRLWL